MPRQGGFGETHLRGLTQPTPPYCTALICGLFICRVATPTRVKYKVLLAKIEYYCLKYRANIEYQLSDIGPVMSSQLSINTSYTEASSS